MVEVEKKIYCQVARVIHSVASWIRVGLSIRHVVHFYCERLRAFRCRIHAASLFAKFLIVIIVTSLLPLPSRVPENTSS